MTNKKDKIDQLLSGLNMLVKKQEDISREINLLRSELNQLKADDSEARKESSTNIKVKESVADHIEPKEQPKILQEIIQQRKQSELEHKIEQINEVPKGKTDLEKFIGENLINKIGIVITIIGIAIGAKYSIEHELISPLMRIVLSYIAGIALLGIGIRLKSKYENYSAVLVSGAMTIMYFITYAAYSFYALFPQVISFILMVVFTIFTVLAALQYNRQVIAHIGMVGAYAVPFLLSDDSGEAIVLMSYMLIINSGILFISFKKYWKPLFYSSFLFTWIIYFTWYIFDYAIDEHFVVGTSFLSCFYIIFYLTFLAYKFFQNEKLQKSDIILLLVNSFVFYGFGYDILNEQGIYTSYLGLFTLANAVIHLIVGLLVYKQKLADKNILYFIMGLVITFVTIAIPVQLSGNWVTLLWVCEALFMFWIGRTKKAFVYEKLSYPLMLLAFVSIIHDWTSLYNTYELGNPDTWITPVFNIVFLSSILFVFALAAINYIHNKYNINTDKSAGNVHYKYMTYLIPIILFVSVYFTFYLEIWNYWHQLYIASEKGISSLTNQFSDTIWNTDLNRFKTVWLINYSLLFVSALTLFNIKWIKNRQFALVNMAIMLVAIALFLFESLYEISELRVSYLQQKQASYYHIGTMNIYIRYISFVFIAISVLTSYFHQKQAFFKQSIKVYFDMLLHTIILWIASSELLHWMDAADAAHSYKLGLSLTWGVYALILIILGIAQQKKHLRLGAISLFGVTLIKLFFYDLTHLNTISKVIVFVSLGVLLLIISFLYNKYKHLISN